MSALPAKDGFSRRLNQTTISQVAESAGVSRATVSRAFGQPDLLNAATVEHVKAVAEKLGYVPNQIARGLSTGRTGNIALVVPDITNAFFASIMRGAQARAREEGYATFLGDCDETPELEDDLLSRLAPQVEGFLLASPRLSSERIRAHAARRPLVLMNRDVAGIPRLLVDAAASYERAVEHLAGLGHSSLAYLAGPAASWSNRQRERAVLRAAHRAGLRVALVRTAKPTYEAGQAAADELAETGVTAILSFDDVMAQGVMSRLAARGIAVPEDVSVIGCDGVLATTTYPPLSSIEVRCNAIGRMMVERLVDLLRGRRARERVVVPTALSLRSTTAAAKDRAGARRSAGAVPAGVPLPPTGPASDAVGRRTQQRFQREDG